MGYWVLRQCHLLYIYESEFVRLIEAKLLQLNSSNTLRQKKSSLMVTISDVTDKPMKQDVTTVAEFTKTTFLSVCPGKGPKE